MSDSNTSLKHQIDRQAVRIDQLEKETADIRRILDQHLNLINFLTTSLTTLIKLTDRLAVTVNKE